LRLFAKKQPTLTREQSLTSVPVRNEALTFEKAEDGSYTIFIPRREAWWVRGLSRMFPLPEGRKISLDEMGSTVLDMCDGETTVKDMITKMGKRFKLSRKEAEVSLLAFLQQLGKKGIVGLAVPKAAEDNDVQSDDEDEENDNSTTRSD